MVISNKTNIIPSNKLIVVTGHKLSDMSCPRRYYFRWIRNLEPKRININFWYGSVLGAGFEAMLSGKDVEKACRMEDRKRCQKHITDSGIEDEMRVQRDLIRVILEGARGQKEVTKMKMTETQTPFAVRLKESGLLYRGTPDGIGVYRGNGCLFEIKTASRVTSSYLDSLMYGKQINGYAYAQKCSGKPGLPECCCCVFHKPEKRIKKGQTIEQFVEEIEGDIVRRPEMYYVWHSFHLGTTTVAETGNDIEKLSSMLKWMYDSKTEKQLLDPMEWPKQENKCYDYLGCEFQMLCKNAKQWHMYERLYQQREMLYEEERQELK